MNVYQLQLINPPPFYFSSLDGDDVYALGWVYVVAWVNTGLLFVCALTVIIDKGEELTEREKVKKTMKDNNVRKNNAKKCK